MSLYQKTLLIVSSILLGLTLVTYGVVSFIIIDNYTQLEAQLIGQQLAQAETIWQQETNCVDYTFTSWLPHQEGKSLRIIYQQAHNDLTYLLVTLLTIGFASGLLMVTALNRHLLVPLRNLSADVSRVGQSDDLSARVMVNGKDELAHLGRLVNGILAGKAHLFMRVDTQRKVMRRLSRQLINAQEEERRQLSRELHDGFGQMLMAIKLNLDLARRAAPPQNKLHHCLNEATGLATQVQEMARNLSLELHPAILEDLGLIAALHCEIDRYEQRTGQAVHFEATLPEAALPTEINITIYRVVIEALTNVARHADAYQVWVRLNLQDDQIHLQIEDDGLGFEVQTPLDAPRHRKSLGLVSIKERVEILDGDFQLISHRHVGTLIDVVLPLTV